METTTAEPASAEEPISEAEIAQKVRAGLTGAQAVEAIKAQRAHDAALPPPVLTFTTRKQAPRPLQLDPNESLA